MGKRASCVPRGRLHAAVRFPDPYPVSATSSVAQVTDPGQQRGSGVERYYHSVALPQGERDSMARGASVQFFL